VKGGGRVGGKGTGREVAQTMYIHMNKYKNNKKECKQFREVQRLMLKTITQNISPSISIAIIDIS
jgi:hypothetical protein